MPATTSSMAAQGSDTLGGFGGADKFLFNTDALARQCRRDRGLRPGRRFVLARQCGVHRLARRRAGRGRVPDRHRRGRCRRPHHLQQRDRATCSSTPTVRVARRRCSSRTSRRGRRWSSTAFWWCDLTRHWADCMGGLHFAGRPTSRGFDLRLAAPGRLTHNSHMHVAASKRLTHQGAKTMMDAAVAARARPGLRSRARWSTRRPPDRVRAHGRRALPTVHSATKAVCAASNKRPTTAKGAAGQALDTMHALGLALAAGPERWTAMEGGYPIIVDGVCVGGIGVSGGNWELDDRSRARRWRRSARADENRASDVRTM